jgi:hypothetical protein
VTKFGETLPLVHGSRANRKELDIAGKEADPRAAPPTSQKPFKGRHARTEKVLKRGGGDALSVKVCYMKQKLTGSRSIVIANAIPGVENVTRRKP